MRPDGSVSPRRDLWASAGRAVQLTLVELQLVVEFGEEPPPLSAPEFVRAAREIVEAAGFSQALLAPFQAGLDVTYTAAERRVSPLWWGPGGIQRLARGAGWGLWLTEGHLAGLGGRERVVREAPVARAMARPAGVWLELTDSPWDVPVAALAALDAYLAPILPTREQMAAADPPENWPAVRANRPTERDEYRGYAGPAAPSVWLSSVELDVAIHVCLAREPSPVERAALERAVLAWYSAGVGGAFADNGAGLHSLDGPEWDGRVATWSVDVGHAQLMRGIAELLRRLGAWAETWGCPIEQVRLGYEGW